MNIPICICNRGRGSDWAFARMHFSSYNVDNFSTYLLNGDQPVIFPEKDNTYLIFAFRNPMSVGASQCNTYNN